MPVPKHEQIKKGVLLAIIEEAELTKEEYRAAKVTCKGTKIKP